MKVYIQLFILLLAFTHVQAQDELMLKGDTVALDFELKIKKITADTIIYRSYRKETVLRTEDVMMYRYKDSSWTFVRKADKEKYVLRQGVLKLKHLQPDIIMRPYEMSESEITRVKSLFDHRARLPYKGKTSVLKKGRSVLVSLYTDTTNSVLGLPLKKIASDSLFFITNLYNKKKLYGVPVRDIRYILIDKQEDIPFAVLNLSLGLVGRLIAEGIMTSDSKKIIELKESDWKIEPIVNE